MYVKYQMMQPGMALLVTEVMFPTIWEKYERAIEEDRSLKFSHNYYSDTDRTVFVKQPPRLHVVAGMPESHTRLVTDRVHSVLSTGTWEFWTSAKIR